MPKSKLELRRGKTSAYRADRTKRNLEYSIPGGSLNYDPLGRLDYISANSANPNATQLDYEGDHLIAERSGAGTILRRYVYGPGTDDPLVWYEGSGTTDRRWLIPDERGSVVAVTNASGSSIATNSYDEYGIPAASNMGRFQYTGQAWLPELGMYYYKARIYSPTLGRFMQTDPIGYADGPNWYGYVHSDPVNRKDSSGFGEDCALVFYESASRLEGYAGATLSQYICYSTSGNGVTSGSFNTDISQGGDDTHFDTPDQTFCKLGSLTAAVGDVGVDVGQYITAGGALSGALVGADVGGVGAVPGLIVGAQPGFAVMGLAGAVSASGNLAMDLSGGNFVEGAERFAIYGLGGKALSSVAEGGAVGYFLPVEAKAAIADFVSEVSQRLIGKVLSSKSPVNCNTVHKISAHKFGI